MNCNFCGNPLDDGRHPLTDTGSRDVKTCQVQYLLLKLESCQELLVEALRVIDRYNCEEFAVDGIAWEARGGKTGAPHAKDVEVIERIREALSDG